MNWLISANPKVYDHSSSFEHYGFIDWKQGNIKYNIDDIVYIYCAQPLKMIQYKCIIEKIDLHSQEIRDDKEYWTKLEDYNKALNGKFMRLKLIEQVSNEKMKLENLRQNGLSSAPQNPMRILNPDLLKYLDTYFSDEFQSDIFPDTLSKDEKNVEGGSKMIYVNKYERSSKAREEAIKYHTAKCFVCEMIFEDIYGEIGKGFIHIHHLVPISTIGEEYQIDYKKDLIPVCPNCHAMLHRKINGKYLTVDELKEIIKNKRALTNVLMSEG